MRTAAIEASERRAPSERWPDLGLPVDFDLDLFLVEDGLRDVGKWEAVARTSLPRSLARLDALGLVHVTLDGFTGEDVNVFFGREPALVDRAAELERAQRTARSVEACVEVSGAIGRLLGYPPCCVDAFVRGPQEDVPALRRLGGSLAVTSPAILDFFPRSFAPVGFVPCRLDCEAALARGARVAQAIERRFGVERAALDAALRGVVLWWSGPHFVLFRGVSAPSPEGFRYGGVATPADSDAYAAIPFVRDEVLRVRGEAARLRRGVRLERGDDGFRVLDAEGGEVHRVEASLAPHFFRFGV